MNNSKSRIKQREMYREKQLRTFVRESMDTAYRVESKLERRLKDVLDWLMGYIEYNGKRIEPVPYIITHRGYEDYPMFPDLEIYEETVEIPKLIYRKFNSRRKERE